MRKRIVTMMAALALGGLGLATGSALAQETSGTAQKSEQKELSGKVLGIDEKTLWIEGKEGEAVPIKVTHETMLQGQRLKRDQRIESHLRREFKPGEEVRTSFELKKEHEGKFENQAVSVEKK